MGSQWRTLGRNAIQDHLFQACPQQYTSLGATIAVHSSQRVVDALESDLAAEDRVGPSEVFAMRDEAPNQFEC